MSEVDYELGKKIVEMCTCECGANLVFCWGGYWGIDSYIVRCAHNISHDRITEVKSLTRLWREGQELPSFIADNIERKHRGEIMEQNDVKAMVVRQDADKLSTYLQVRFPQDLTRRDAALDFAKWCIAHQLEPVRDCVPYHGNPFITVEWLDRQASNDDKFKGYSYKVYGEKEKVALDFDPRDLVVECQADFEGLKKPLVGLGVVTRVEKESKTGGELDEVTAKGYRAPVVHLHPQKMVFKRARAAALKERYHIPAPILEELPYTTIIEAEYTIKDASESEDKTAKSTEKVGAVATSTAAGTEETNREPGARPLPKARAQATKQETVPVTEETSRDEAIEGEGFHIDLTWLSESQKALKWTDDTMKTFLASQYKVSPIGKPLEAVISQLTREQAEDFVNEINSRVEKHEKWSYG